MSLTPAPADDTSTPKKPLVERVNPILLKELRQSLRSRGFMLLFFLVQIIMVIAVVISLRGSAFPDADTRMQNAVIFWSGVSVYLLLFLPMTGLNALQREARDGRMDLLLLTAIAPRTVIFGKWQALLIQGGIVTTSVIPYLIIAYYAGATQILANLGIIAVFTFVSALLCAAAVGFSAISGKMIRAIGFFLMLIAVVILVAVVVESYDELPDLKTDDVVIFGVALVGLGFPFALLLLEFATARFTPTSERSQTRPRLLALGLVGCAALMTAFAPGFADIIRYPLFFALVVTAMHALSQTPPNAPALYRPFTRFGWPGRWFGRLFLYPGWPSALGYIAVVFGVFSLVFFSPRELPIAIAIFFGTIGFLLLPLVVQFLFKINPQRLVRTSLGVHGPALLITILPVVLDIATNSKLRYVFFWNPGTSVTAIASGMVRYSEVLYFLVTPAVVTTILIAITLLQSMHGQRFYRRMEIEAASDSS